MPCHIVALHRRGKSSLGPNTPSRINETWRKSCHRLPLKLHEQPFKPPKGKMHTARPVNSKHNMHPPKPHRPKLGNRRLVRLDYHNPSPICQRPSHHTFPRNNRPWTERLEGIGPSRLWT